MAKKKAQHLYEILAQKSDQVQPLPAEPPASSEQKPPAAEPVGAPPARKRVEIEQPPVPAPIPAGRGQERVLENVVQLRRDTLIVGVLLIIVAVIVAFFIGRATSPDSATEPTPRGSGLGDELGLKGDKEERLSTPGTNEAPEPDAAKQEEAAEEGSEEPAEAEAQPAAQPLEEEWEVRLISLRENIPSAKESLEKRRDHLVDKGYPSAEVIKSGSFWRLRVRGYADSTAAQAAKRELAELEYEGRREFADSEIRRMNR
jgi:hypothetical protein